MLTAWQGDRVLWGSVIVLKWCECWGVERVESCKSVAHENLASSLVFVGMCVCMSICVCVCIWMYKGVCGYVTQCTRAHVCEFMCMRDAYMSVWVCACMCVWAHMHASVSLCACVSYGLLCNILWFFLKFKLQKVLASFLNKVTNL